MLTNTEMASDFKEHLKSKEGIVLQYLTFARVRSDKYLNVSLKVKV